MPDRVHEKVWREHDQQLMTHIASQCPQDILDVVGEAQKMTDVTPGIENEVAEGGKRRSVRSWYAKCTPRSNSA